MLRSKKSLDRVPDMKKTTCRLCKSKDLNCFLDLGFHPHSDQFRATVDNEESYYPLRVARCRDCGFVQLDYVVPPQEMYQKDYFYESSITATGAAHWTEFASTVVNKLGLKPGDGMIDIGSNDGTLLSKFKALGMKVCGIDPCKELTDIANSRGIPSVNDFFSSPAVKLAKNTTGEIKLITGSNVFAHIDDLDDVMKVVTENLAADGVFVFESPYFGDFFEGLQYDTVYHQHLSYISLKPVVQFFKKFGLEVFDIDRRPIHGGSFRVYSGRNRKPNAAVNQMLESENWTDADMESFAKKTMQHREDLFDLVYSLHKQGKKIAAISSPAKGQTLLNYTGVGRYMEFATDKSKLKQGRYTPGTHLKILSDDELIKTQPDYALLLAWNFADEIMRNNKDYKGKWIIPIPTPRIV